MPNAELYCSRAIGSQSFILLRLTPPPSASQVTGFELPTMLARYACAPRLVLAQRSNIVTLVRILERRYFVDQSKSFGGRSKYLPIFASSLHQP